MLQKGQRVLVNWDRHGWLPGIFLDYAPGLAGEEFDRCMVSMDNGWACNPPGFHPDCVAPAVKPGIQNRLANVMRQSEQDDMIDEYIIVNMMRSLGGPLSHIAQFTRDEYQDARVMSDISGWRRTSNATIPQAVFLAEVDTEF